MTHRVPPASEYPLIELASPSGLRAQLYPDGRLFALRCGEVLINQVLPTPCEAAMTRLYLRERGGTGRAVTLVGPPLPEEGAPGLGEGARRFLGAAGGAAHWRVTGDPIEARVTLQVHPERPAWVWHVVLRNAGADRREVDVLYGQDLGLAHEGHVRGNEAYCSQYIDHRVEVDPSLGPVVLSRQNQAQDGKYPWVAQGCLEGAAAWSTDGFQLFGVEHRLTGRPAALDLDRLPCANLQYEMAYPALQSLLLTLGPGEEAAVRFFGAYQADHPAASGEADLEWVRRVVSDWPAPEPAPREAPRQAVPTLFESPWLHGEDLGEADWRDLFPGERRHEERDGSGRLLSFFTPDGRHVVARAKEAVMERPHAHILRSGSSLWLEEDILGTTVAMAGAFNAQVFLGNTNLCRFLSVLRNPLSVMRGSGQRVFVREGEAWRQLGVPSAFEMGPSHARWLYRVGGGLLEVTTRAAEGSPRVDLELRVARGAPRAFLVSHQVVMGDAEMAQPFTMAADEGEGRVECRPDPDSLLGRSRPGLRFTLEADPAGVERLGGDELLFADGVSREAPFAVVVTRKVACFTLSLRGDLGLPSGAEVPEPRPDQPSVRQLDVSEIPPAGRAPEVQRVGLPRLRHEDEAAARLSDVLPWFAHDAWIHFTTPHGLEQYGGAAWGTRDVCQGPVEWLLAARRPDAVRRILLKVFEQQYEDGGWPQWFMHEPFRFIQSPHSHGDILYWPLKALCDYVEASGDLSVLHEEVPYTDLRSFTSTERRAPLTEHVERALALHEARCLPGTSLVSYGDGDWDDTLQPADPELRACMVSAWTVGLAYDVFRRYRAVCERAGLEEIASRLGALLERVREDFHRRLMPDGVTAGFMVFGEEGPRPLLHPRDTVTGIRYRLLPMTRGVLAELFTPEEAEAHLGIVRERLLCPDGVRLMSDPVPYRGGVERWFRRAETAANFGREIGLMYVHAHLRYAEALAKVGDGEGLWRALQVVNPIGLEKAVPSALPRQANVYFTSSDGDFPDRYEAARRFHELREGRVPVKGGWRLYSSGPGLFLHKVITRLLGLRDSFGDVVIDPVLPRCLDGLTAEMEWDGRPLEVRYQVSGRGFGPSRVTVNGRDLPVSRRDPNPYRDGGPRVASHLFRACLGGGPNRMEVIL